MTESEQKAITRADLEEEMLVAREKVDCAEQELSVAREDLDRAEHELSDAEDRVEDLEEKLAALPPKGADEELFFARRDPRQMHLGLSTGRVWE